MRRVLVSLLAVFGFWLVFSGSASIQERHVERRGGVDVSGPYEVDPNWPRKTWPAPGHIWGSQAGVYPESADRIFLASRGEIKLPPDLKIGPDFSGNWGALDRGAATGQIPVFRNTILVVDRQGNLLESWTQWDKLFEGGRGPHQIYVQPYDPERHVWVIDDMNHVIHKFTNDGKKLLMTLGQKGDFGTNDDLTRFNRPTMMDWLPDGTFFVSDGYANSRVVKFDKNGKPQMWWGSMAPGKEPGEFTVPHGIAVGDDRRVYVSDRFNQRIQVFDENGIYLDQWPSGYCHTVSMSRDQHLWCYDGRREEFIKYDLRGHIETVFGRFGTYPGATWAVHQISADDEGNMYAAEVFGGRTQKFVPKPHADSSQLFWGRPLAPKTPVRQISTVRMAPATMAAGTAAPARPMPDFSGAWQYDRAQSQAARTGGMGSGVAEPPVSMVVRQTAEQITVDLTFESGGSQRAVYRLDGEETATPRQGDSVNPYKRRMRWDGARMTLFTIDGLNQIRERWLVEGNVLKMERAGQSPGGADSITRNLVYNKSQK